MTHTHKRIIILRILGRRTHDNEITIIILILILIVEGRNINKKVVK